MLAHWWEVRVSKTLKLLPTHWQVKPDLGLVPDYWQAELLPGVWLQGQGSQSSFQIAGVGGRPVPETVGYGVWGVPKVVLAC